MNGIRVDPEPLVRQDLNGIPQRRFSSTNCKFLKYMAVGTVCLGSLSWGFLETGVRLCRLSSTIPPNTEIQSILENHTFTYVNTNGNANLLCDAAFFTGILGTSLVMLGGFYWHRRIAQLGQEANRPQ